MKEDITATLLRFINEHFSSEELEVLCFGTIGHDMMQNWKGAGHTRDKLGMELIGYCKRFGVLDNLLANVEKARPLPYAQHFKPIAVAQKPASRVRDPHQVFISHSSKDAEIAHRLADDLRKAGLNVWITPSSIQPLEVWEDAIERGLTESGKFVLLASPNAAQSTWVKQETRVAYRSEQKGHLQLYPVLIEDCDLTDIYIYLDKQAFHCQPDRYDEGVRQLLAAMGIVDYEAQVQLLQAEVEGLKRQLMDMRRERDSAKSEAAKAKQAYVALESQLREAEDKLTLAQQQISALDNENQSNRKKLQQAQASLANALEAKDAALLKVKQLEIELVEAKKVRSLPARWRLDTPFALDFSLIAAGEFLMGSADSDKQADSEEKPQHKLFLPDFYMAKTPITVAQFEIFVRETGYKTSAEIGTGGWTGGFMFDKKIAQWVQNHEVSWRKPFGKDSDVSQKANHPVTQVSYYDAVAFCEWLSKQSGQLIRLPSEAEWEKAARGADGRLYAWGNQAPDNSRCNYNRALDDTSEVGKYSPLGDTPVTGLQDMTGNVWEWTRSRFGAWRNNKVELKYAYPYNAADGRENLDKLDDAVDLIVRRGGSLTSISYQIRSAHRQQYNHHGRVGDIGFRVVRGVAPVS